MKLRLILASIFLGICACVIGFQATSVSAKEQPPITSPSPITKSRPITSPVTSPRPK